MKIKNIKKTKVKIPGLLNERFPGHWAQISTRGLLHVKSAIKEVARMNSADNRVPPFIEKLCGSIPHTPQGINDLDFVNGYIADDGTEYKGLLDEHQGLLEYTKRYPEQWETVKKCLKLVRAHGRHACFATGTLIDNNGSVRPIELSEFSCEKSIKTWKTGVRDTILVCLNNGVVIRCTPEHVFITPSGEIEARDLLDQEIVYKPFINVSGDKEIDQQEAFFLGWALNDGSVTMGDQNNSALYFTPDKDIEVKEYILDYLNKKNITWWENKNRPDMIYIGKENVPNYFFNQKNRNKDQRLPSFFWSLNFNSQCSYLRGLFSANGFVLNTRPRCGIKIASKMLGSDIAIWFNAKNILTSACFKKPHMAHCFGRTISSNGNVELIISNINGKRWFEENIGFFQTYKKNRLNEINKPKKHQTNFGKEKTIKVITIEKTTPTEVWDFNQPDGNVGYISGVLVHNSAYLVADKPIDEVVPLMTVSDVRVTQPTMAACEAMGLIKMDFLGLKTLKDIGKCLELIQKDNPLTEDFYILNKVKVPAYRVVPYNNNLYDIWKLPDDSNVYNDICEGATETVFQLNTPGAQKWLKEVNYYRPNSDFKLINSIEDIAVFTALDRPGPLDAVVTDGLIKRNMLQEYYARARGLDPVDEIKSLTELIPETYGVLVYQESLQNVYQRLTGCSGIDANKFREDISKKRMDKVNARFEYFMEKASPKIGAEDARKVWSQMVTFGQYGFNKSHSVAYSIIAYATAFLKHHFPLQWWCAVLTNAVEDKKDDITDKFWKHCNHLVVLPDINLSEKTFTIKNGKIIAPISILHGVAEKSHEELMALRPFKDIQELVEKHKNAKISRSTVTEDGKVRKGKSPLNKGQVCQMIASGVLDSLFPPRMDLMSKIDLFLTTSKKAGESLSNSSYEEFMSRFRDLNRLQLYQFKKNILPIYSENLLPMIEHIQGISKKEVKLPTITFTEYKYLPEDPKTIGYFMKALGLEKMFHRGIPLLNQDQLHQLNKEATIPEKSTLRVGVACYVLSYRKFSYQDKKTGDILNAAEFVVDIEGSVYKFLQWPNFYTRDTVLPSEDLNGAIILLILSKYKEFKPFNVDCAIPISLPLEKKK